MKPRHFRLGLAAALLLGGCARKHDESHASDEPAHAHADDGESADDREVSFSPDHGLRLSPAVVAALDLKTVVVAEHPIASDQRLTAQVFAVRPRTLASVRLPADHADEWTHASVAGARLVQVDRSAARASSFVDLVFELTDGAPHATGDFVELALDRAPVVALAVPRSAVLDGAAGAFVYVVGDGAYRRTPVQTGVRGRAFVALTAGVRAGDRIVTTAVDQLWLAELRLTKGGGHSH